MSLWELQPDGLEEIRMYLVYYLRILIGIICLRQGNKLLMSEEKPQKVESAVVVSKWISSVIIMLEQWDPGGSGWSPYTLGKGVTLKNVLEAGNWERVSMFKRFYC